MKILIATDGSDLSRKAIDIGVGLAKSLRAAVLGVAAVPPNPYAALGGEQEPQLADLRAKAGALGNEYLSVVEQAARAAGVPVETVIREEEAPHRAILSAAVDAGCELIVMASHGRSGYAAVLLGSETQKVLAFSTVPVLVVR
ncbi:MAG: universal stress protein [Betaproteobacteria bacterium]